MVAKAPGILYLYATMSLISKLQRRNIFRVAPAFATMRAKIATDIAADLSSGVGNNRGAKTKNREFFHDPPVTTRSWLSGQDSNHMAKV